MEIIGKTTIHPVVFYSGKLSGYITWIILALVLSGMPLPVSKIMYYNPYISLIILFAGLILTTISLIHLGKSTRLGLPSEATKLKTSGIYKVSRNPMYVGFNLITLSAMVYTLNWLVLCMGIYSMLVYHFIIKGEEKFMKQRFGKEYEMYQSKVRRYL